MHTSVQRHESDMGWWEHARRAPHPALRPFVRRYAGFQESTGVPLRRREMPGGELELIISFGPLWRITLGGPRASTPGWCGSFTGGMHDGYVLSEHQGTAHGVQVGLTPAGAQALLGVPPGELTRMVVVLEDLLGPAAAELEERLVEAPGWAARFDLLDDVLGGWLADARCTSPDVARAWRRLEETHGSVPIGALTEELRCSRRHLAAAFREQIGLPPKTCARLLRFQRVVGRLRQEGAVRWADIAHECGYYDQPHFNRDFRQFAGITPSEFLAGLLPAGAGVAAEPEITSVQDAQRAAA
jgi:AraC-like DNA-binding protein